MQLEDDVSIACIVIADINCDDIENMIVGSMDGVVKVVNVGKLKIK